MTSQSNFDSKFQEFIDPRGPRVTAGITVIVVAITLLTHSWIPATLQLIQFAIGGFVSPKVAPYGLFFRKVVQPRLVKNPNSENIKGPQFAQKIGFLFGALILSGIVFDVKPVFYIGAIGALIAAILNSVFDYCLGCQLYLVFKRFNLIK